ncbi:TetR/AcrR family transcriptional regulator [Niveispirillum irakense]|uniref:TetR/AcrR family transcriptional regulator n=1 Tax=Niveispirillum irakense TaxID=34011 RepID=UPI001378FDC7|nr:TetR/AcrR family transcriptional regulator [Niveispirillum irakense]
MPPRRKENPDKADIIIASAARLFREKGVRAVSIDEIVQASGIAKGTFYLYFKTKDDLLEKLAIAVVRQMARSVAAEGLKEGSSAIDRFIGAVLAMQHVDRHQQYLVDALNHPENYALHELTNVQLVRQVAPVLAVIVTQGKKEGVFDVEDAQATLEFLLAGQAMLLGGGRFNWSPQEYAARLRATFIIIERSLGTAPGALVGLFAALGSASNEAA